MSRPTWSEYFMEVAKLVSRRSTCPRASVGCVLVKDNQIIATGYNGSAPGMPHCDDHGCEIREGHCQRTLHAEVNAVGQAARNGASTVGSTAYVTHTPCLHCAKVLVAAGVTQIIAGESYGSHATLIHRLYGLEIHYG